MPLYVIRYTLSLLFLCLFVAGLYAQGGPPGPRRGGPPGGERRGPGGPPDGRWPGGPPPDRRGRPDDEPRRRREPLPDGPGMFNILSSEMRFGDKPVKHAPYSAQATIESTQALPDGTHITRKLNATLYRDSEGRVRREQTIGFVSVLGDGGNAPPLVFITDPMAGVHYVLDPERLTARRMRLHQHGPPPPPPPAGDDATVTEALGKKTLEGVEVEGARTTTTIPVGQIGNDRPIKIVSERWYAPALQIVVLSTHNDPRLGEHTYRLTNIKREEPARTLFEVPSNYKVEEDKSRPPRGAGKDRGGPPMPLKKPSV